MPLSIATTNQKLRTGDRAVLLHILSDKHVTDAVPATEERACVIIDGMALVHSLSKPVGANTFGDFAGLFYQSVLSHLSQSQNCVDVVFDDYPSKSTKSGTRTQRGMKHRKIR